MISALVVGPKFERQMENIAMLDAPDAGRGNDPDPVAKVIRALGIPFVALNPGASFRGLHEPRQ